MARRIKAAAVAASEEQNNKMERISTMTLRGFVEMFPGTKPTVKQLAKPTKTGRIACVELLDEKGEVKAIAWASKDLDSNAIIKLAKAKALSVAEMMDTETEQKIFFLYQEGVRKELKY